MTNYIEKNRASWNARTDYHIKSDFYDMEGFLKGASSLNEVELKLLGDVTGKSILHLQCHFGQDTLSMARLGAEVTGADLSDKAIQRAGEIAAQAGLNASFVSCDIYDLPAHLNNQKFDIVFTSYGAIGWLPDMVRWGGVVSHFLKPGGRLVLVEFHPVVWLFDDAFSRIAFPYFNTGAITELCEGTYADRQAPISHECVSWNHPVSEVISGVLGNGLSLVHFEELDYSPYACFDKVTEIAPRKFQIPGLEGKIPMLYSVVAMKPLAG